jgi:hypothetical protein
MMQADNILSTRLTCGVKGSHTTTRDVEGDFGRKATTMTVNHTTDDERKHAFQENGKL